MKTNTETKILESINILLGAEKELIVLKGQLQNPVRREKKDTREAYYEFVVKTLRKNSDDEYGQGYNRYHCVMPSDVAKNFNDDLIKELKGNEVLVLCNSSCSVREFKKEGQPPVYLNNISLYVIDLMKTRDVNKNETTKSYKL